MTRTLRPGDLPGLQELLSGLGPDDRALRFGHAVDDVDIEAHCRAIAQAGHAVWVLGAFEGAQLVGAAELWFDAGPVPRTCEVAFEIEASWRGRGIGSELLGRAVLVACNRWTLRLHLAWRPENRRMLRLARRFAGDVRSDDGDTAEAEVVLPHPSWYSSNAEAAMEAHGLMAVSALR